MAIQKADVKVRIVRDCEGPGDGYKVDQEAVVTPKDAEILRRRGFAVILADEKVEPEKK